MDVEPAREVLGDNFRSVIVEIPTRNVYVYALAEDARGLQIQRLCKAAENGDGMNVAVVADLGVRRGLYDAAATHINRYVDIVTAAVAAPTTTATMCKYGRRKNHGRKCGPKNTHQHKAPAPVSVGGDYLNISLFGKRDFRPAREF